MWALIMITWLGGVQHNDVLEFNTESKCNEKRASIVSILSAAGERSEDKSFYWIVGDCTLTVEE